MFDNVQKLAASGVFAPLTDTRWVTDLLDTGADVEVLRTDHEDYADWKESLFAGGATERIVKERMKAELAGQMREQAEILAKGEAPRAGFRAQKRESKAERASRLAAVAPTAVDYDEVADRAMAGLSMDDLRLQDINIGKKGVALLLIRNWRGVTNEGIAVDPTLSNRLLFLGWSGFLIWVPVGSGITGDAPVGWRQAAGDLERNPVLLTRDEFSSLDPGSGLSRAIVSGQLVPERFTGPICGSDGTPLYVTSGKFSGYTVGDALALAIIEAGDEQAEAAGRAAEVAEANLEDGPSGGHGG